MKERKKNLLCGFYFFSSAGGCFILITYDVRTLTVAYLLSQTAPLTITTEIIVHSDQPLEMIIN